MAFIANAPSEEHVSFPTPVVWARLRDQAACHAAGKSWQTHTQQFEYQQMDPDISMEAVGMTNGHVFTQ